MHYLVRYREKMVLIMSVYHPLLLSNACYHYHPLAVRGLPGGPSYRQTVVSGILAGRRGASGAVQEWARTRRRRNIH